MQGKTYPARELRGLLAADKGRTCSVANIGKAWYIHHEPCSIEDVDKKGIDVFVAPGAPVPTQRSIVLTVWRKLGIFLLITVVLLLIVIPFQSCIHGWLWRVSKGFLRSWTDLSTDRNWLFAGVNVVKDVLEGIGLLTSSPTSIGQVFATVLLGLPLFILFGLVIGLSWVVVWLCLLLAFSILQVGTEAHLFPALLVPPLAWWLLYPLVLRLTRGRRRSRVRIISGRLPQRPGFPSKTR